MVDLRDIDYLGLDRVIKRGTGKIIADEGKALLVKDIVSSAYFLACEDRDVGTKILERYIGDDCRLLMVSDYELGKSAYKKFGFEDMIECYQVAYYGERPKIETQLDICVAEESDLPMLIENYDMISKEELTEVVKRRSILLGYYNNELIGFIGEHLEGSMGLLYVFPEYRKKGFATALQKAFIARTIEQGFIPFGQVEKDNMESLNLQKKLGMTKSDNLIAWMWR